MEKTPARQVLAHNLRSLMKRTPDLDTQEKLAKRAGVAQTSVSQILRPDNTAAKSPKLDQVEKIAFAFGLATWQLLLDHQTVGPAIADLLMRPALPTEEVSEVQSMLNVKPVADERLGPKWSAATKQPSRKTP